MTYTLNNSLARIQRRQIEIATGKRILSPSDDPAGTVRAMALRGLIDDNLQYRSNIQDGLSWVTGTEEPLNSVIELLNKMKETAISAADDATEDRTFMGDIVDDILTGMINQSRSKVNGRYIFSGFRTDTAPYTTADAITGESFTAAAVGVEADLVHARVSTGSVTITNLAGTTTYTEGTDYTVDYETGRVSIVATGAMVAGTDYLANYTSATTGSVTAITNIQGNIVRQIDSDRTVPVNLRAPDVFQDSIDIFQMSIDLKNALWKDDSDAVRAMMDDIDTAIEHVTEQLGVIGTRADTLQRNQLLLDTHEISLREFLSEIEDNDLTESVIQLETEQAAYEAALASTARLMQITIVNYL